jgi:hypothetical protein
MGGHKIEGYGLYGHLLTVYSIAYLKAPSEVIWLMLGHPVKGYGLWEGTKLRYMADIGHLLKVYGLCYGTK